MAHIISLSDGSKHTLLSEQDFYELVEDRMGSEALAYMKEIIGEMALLSQEQAEDVIEDLNNRYEALKEKYEKLKHERSK